LREPEGRGRYFLAGDLRCGIVRMAEYSAACGKEFTYAERLLKSGMRASPGMERQ
jgi:hypothetical protein